MIGRAFLSPEGPLVSRISYGAWRFRDEGGDPPLPSVHERIDTCLELGITTFDHADIYGDYGCEKVFGRALAERPQLRDRMEIVTKCGIKLISKNRPDHTLHHYDTSRDHIVTSVENSLKALQTDRIDLLLIHRPNPFMDADDTANGLREVVESGKVINVGVSNFSPPQFDLLASRLDKPLVCNQIEIHALRLTPFLDGTIDHLEKLRIAPMAWSPLGGGALMSSHEAHARRVRTAMLEVGKEFDGAGVDQIALAWLLAHPSGIIPVIGTNKPERITRMVKAAEIRLSREQWFKIWIASLGHPVP